VKDNLLFCFCLLEFIEVHYFKTQRCQPSCFRREAPVFTPKIRHLVLAVNLPFFIQCPTFTYLTNGSLPCKSCTKSRESLDCLQTLKYGGQFDSSSKNKNKNGYRSIKRSIVSRLTSWESHLRATNTLSVRYARSTLCLSPPFGGPRFPPVSSRFWGPGLPFCHCSRLASLQTQLFQYFAPGMVASVVINTSICLYACPREYLKKTTCVNIIKFSVCVTCWWYCYMLCTYDFAGDVMCIFQGS